MGKRSNKGFTMVEILLVLLMISLISLVIGMPLVLESKTTTQATHYQLEAMAKQKTIAFRDGITFNHRGNINQGKTIYINQRKCVFQLGMGRYLCE